MLSILTCENKRPRNEASLQRAVDYCIKSQVKRHSPKSQTGSAYRRRSAIAINVACQTRRLMPLIILMNWEGEV
jgi:hypothetical protein